MCPAQQEAWGQILLAENKSQKHLKKSFTGENVKVKFLLKSSLNFCARKKILDVKYRRQIISFEVLYKIKSKPKKQYVCRYLGN